MNKKQKKYNLFKLAITPYYGHTMKAYRNYAYIYGGFNGDTLNELIVMNLKTMNYKPTFLAPFRRK